MATNPPGGKVAGLSKRNATIGILAAVGVGGYLLYRHEKNTAVAAATPATAATSAYGYGSGYGSYGYGGGYGYGESGGIYPGASGAAYGEGYYGYSPYGYGGVGTVSSEPAATTNAQWAQEAISALEQSGVTAATAVGAVGEYLAGGTLSASQQQLISEAEGLIGPPPNPPAASVAPSTGQSGSSSSGTGSSTGTTASSKTAAGPISNLQTRSQTATSVTIGWNPATGATQGYSWKLTGPVNKSGSTKSTSTTISGLKAGTYNFGIQGLPGGAGNNIHVTMKG